MPGFAAHEGLMFINPIGHTLRAISFDRSSADRTGFYAHVLLQPLCLPLDHLVLNAGWRLGCDTRLWRLSLPAAEADLASSVVSVAGPYLTPLRTPNDVATALQASNKLGDATVVQMMAYTLARAGDISRATEALEQLQNMLIGDTRDWVRQRFDDVVALQRTLRRNPAEALRQLVAQEARTARALGLARFY